MRATLEQVLFEFETCWLENESAALEDFLPDPADPNYLEVLTELVRSDMEFRIENSRECSAADYFRRFPILVNHSHAKKAVVFEEYRLRSGQGENLVPDVLCAQYDIDSTGWPVIQPSAHPSDRRRSTTQFRPESRTPVVFPKVGESFLGFELVGKLGDGAFGKVFLAQQGDLAGRLVVLKFTSAITDEHRLLARLQHTNIVPIHSVHRTGDLQAICMPLLGVATLEDILRQCGKQAAKRFSIASNALVQTVTQQRELTVAETICNENDAQCFRSRQRLHDEPTSAHQNHTLQHFAANFMLQAAEGLGYAHQKGIVHCDLKPANILVDDDGKAVILDFHLGYSIQENIGHHIGGTLPYMAPEHLRALEREEGELQPTADVYSAGVMLYEVLTGKLPYESDFSDHEYSLESLAKQKEVPFVVPKTKRAKIGEDLSAIIETCLDPNPAKRFQDGHQLACELDRHLNFQPLQTAPKGSLKNRVQKWAKRNPRISSASTILAACSVVMIAIAAAFFMVKAELDRLDAIAQKNNHIELAQSLNPVFATARSFVDRSYFEDAILKGNQIAKQNMWHNADDLIAQSYFGRLEADEARTELTSAAELHFWLAEASARLALTKLPESKKYLRMAFMHNQCAVSFWPKNLSKKCLVTQQQNLRALTGEKGSLAIPVDKAVTSNNRPDRLLSAYLLIQRNSNRAEQIFDKLVEEKKGDFDAWLLLGHSCTMLKKFEKAQSCYTVCRSLDPTSSLPLLCRGNSKIEQGNFEGALDDLKLADRLLPNDVTITLNYALALYKNRDFKNAEAKFDRAIDLGAQQTRALLLRSRIRKFLGDEAGAKKDYEAFLDTEPSDEKSCLARGAQKAKNAPEDAIEDFERALKINPRSATACNNIASVYSEILDDTESGIEFMNQAIEIDRVNPKFLAGRGVLLARTGKREPAIEDAETALRLDSSADTLYRVAGIYAQTSKIEAQDKKRAISLFAKAALKDPSLVLRMLRNDPDILPVSKDEAFSTIVNAITKLQEVWAQNSGK